MSNSTGASDRSFYPIFNKKFDHLETLHRPDNTQTQKSFVSWIVVQAFSAPSPK